MSIGPNIARLFGLYAPEGHRIAALFVRADSAYKALPGVDAYDAARDARSFPGGCPVVAHPPCRAWGRLRQFASKVRPDEKALGPWAVEQVRRFGGVLEHPRQSTLWDHCGLPMPGACFTDAWGGYSIEVDQFHFGHKAQKRTWFYVVGVPIDALPPIPQRGGVPTHCVRPTRSYPRLPSITKAEREHTPMALCLWLVEVARRAGGLYDPAFAVSVPDAPAVPPVLNHDPRITGDAHRLLKRAIQQRVIAEGVQ
jgi:hypothetical protein